MDCASPGAPLAAQIYADAHVQRLVRECVDLARKNALLRARNARLEIAAAVLLVLAELGWCASWSCAHRAPPAGAASMSYQRPASPAEERGIADRRLC